MAPPITAPIQRPPQGRRFYWGMEDVAVGTPPAATVGHPVYVESVSGFDIADQRDIYTADEIAGAMTSNVGMDELTHYTQATLTSPFRAHGITGRMAACMMGNQLYVPTGAGPYVHTIPLAPYTNRTNTISCWYQTTIDPANTNNYVKFMPGTTVTSMTFTFGAGSALNVEAAVWGRWPLYSVPPAGFTALSAVTGVPTTTSVPLTTGSGSQFTAGSVTIGAQTGTVTSVTGDTLTLSPALASAPVAGQTVQQVSSGTAVYVGGDVNYTITRTMGYQGTFTIRSSSGATYTPRVLSGTITMERPAEAVFAADSQTIVDIALGPLNVSGTMVFQFDGYAVGTVARDYSDFKKTGTWASPSVIRFTDADGNYIEWQSEQWVWNPFSLDYTGQYVKGSGSFTAVNDPTMVFSGTPQLSVLKNLVLRNNIATAMILP